MPRLSWESLPRFLRRRLNRPRIALILHAISRSPEAKAARAVPMTWVQSWERAAIINAIDYSRTWRPPADLWQFRAAESKPRLTQEQYWGAER